MRRHGRVVIGAALVLCTLTSFVIIQYATVTVTVRASSAKPPASKVTPGQVTARASSAKPPASKVNPGQVTARASSAKTPASKVTPAQPPFKADRSVRDPLWQEDWPERQSSAVNPQQEASTVHYLWCGAGRQFRFQDYLSVLSVVRVLRPLKVLFHYDTPPLTDKNRYNTWFEELKSAIPGLELHQADLSASNFLDNARRVLSPTGGVVIGNDVILSRPPNLTGALLALPASPTSPCQGQLFADKGDNNSLNKNTPGVVLKETPSTTNVCISVESYNKNANGTTGSDVSGGGSSSCVVAPPDLLLPTSLAAEETPFAELARWLFYGKRGKQVATADPANPIPRWCHYVMFTGSDWTLTFSQYVGVLSALYVAGFTHVFLHVERAPGGPWWAELAAANENVTVVLIDRPRSVYQTNVNVIQHVSDVARAEILYKYGGAYQDWDVVWANRVPDGLLAYPAVMGFEDEWYKHISKWPEIFNNGVMLSRRQAPWLRHFLETMRDYRDGDWAYNSLRMSYKTYQQYPDTVFAYRKLQMICAATTCYPTWAARYDTARLQSGDPFPLMEQALAVHLAYPKPYRSLSSPQLLKAGKDVFADLGRHVLRRSGRQRLIE